MGNTIKISSLKLNLLLLLLYSRVSKHRVYMIFFIDDRNAKQRRARRGICSVWFGTFIYIFIYMLISTQQAMHSALHTKYKTETPHSAYHRFFIKKRIFDIYMNKMLEIYDNKNQWSNICPFICSYLVHMSIYIGASEATTSSQYLDLKYPKFLSAESGPRMGPRWKTACVILPKFC